VVTGLRLLPQSERDWNGIDVELLPPYGLITRTMDLVMVQATNRNEKFVAYYAPKSARLHEPEVMGIRRRTATDKASLPHNELTVIFVAQAHRFVQRRPCASVFSLSWKPFDRRSLSIQRWR
jgi:hypothetical protein